MKLIGNYSWWVTDDLMNYLESLTSGVTTIWDPDRWTGHPVLEKYKKLAEPGYSIRKDWFQQFFKQSPAMQEREIDIPTLPEMRKEVFWWIVKVSPGQIQPIHIDPHLTTAVNPLRYTMFLQDWQPGHIFIYGTDSMIENYKKGDVFLWEDPMMEHAVANIGYETRYTVQIAMHDALEGEFIGGSPGYDKK
jgi:hypothetical protein